MARFGVWEFDDDAVFDGKSMFAEVSPEAERCVRAGTLELSIRPYSIRRSTIFSNGVPVRDEGAFAVVLTHAGAVSLTCTTGTGEPVRLQTPEGFVSDGERLQITLSWGPTGRFSVVNTDRLAADPSNPTAGNVAPVPLRARIRIGPERVFTFGAADQGTAPYFHGRILCATLSDTVDAPTVTPPTATVHNLAARWRAAVRPRRVQSARDSASGSRPDQASAEGVRSRPRTRIATSEGERAMVNVAAGDEVLTRDHGLQTVRWVGHATLDWDMLTARPHLKPVFVRKGALGQGMPEADMFLPPHARVVVTRRDLARAYDGRQVLISAHKLIGTRGIFEVDAMGVTYSQLLFDQSELIQANGIWLESFNPADSLRGGLYDAQRHELYELFPELRRTATGTRS